jgi:hypothetical protein
MVKPSYVVFRPTADIVKPSPRQQKSASKQLKGKNHLLFGLGAKIGPS